MKDRQKTSEKSAWQSVKPVDAFIGILRRDITTHEHIVSTRIIKRTGDTYGKNPFRRKLHSFKKTIILPEKANDQEYLKLRGIEKILY